MKKFLAFLFAVTLAVSVNAVAPSEFYHRRGGRIEGFSIIDGEPPVSEFRKQTSQNVKNKHNDNASRLAKELIDRLETYEERISATEGRLDANEARIKKYSTNLLKVARNINILYGRFNWLREEITGLTARVGATEQVLGNRDEEITVIKDIVESMN